MLKPRTYRTILRAVVLTGVFLGLFEALALSVSPDIHEVVHHDADEPGHHCLVTILESGGFESTFLPVLVEATTPEVCAVLPMRQQVLECSSGYTTCFKRGPPAGMYIV